MEEQIISVDIWPVFEGDEFSHFRAYIATSYVHREVDLPNLEHVFDVFIPSLPRGCDIKCMWVEAIIKPPV
jgi:hypothetical protein